MQQERGLHVSIEAWERAVKEAGTLVTLAEKKLHRKESAFATRIAKLEVCFFLLLLNEIRCIGNVGNIAFAITG